MVAVGDNIGVAAWVGSSHDMDAPLGFPLARCEKLSTTCKVASVELRRTSGPYDARKLGMKEADRNGNASSPTEPSGQRLFAGPPDLQVATSEAVLKGFYMCDDDVH